MNEFKVIRMRRGRVLEKSESGNKYLKEAQPRKLEGDEELSADKLPPRYKFEMFIEDTVKEVKSIVKNFLPGCEIRQDIKTFYVSYGGHHLFEYNYKEQEGEEPDTQQIDFEFANLAIGSEFSLQKVRLSQTVKDYIRFYIGGYMLLVGQTVTSMRQVEGDITAAIALGTEHTGASDVNLDPTYYKASQRIKGFGASKEERRLYEEYEPVKEYLQPKLKGVIVNKYLDLKKKKYVSTKESALKALDRLAKFNNIEQPKEIKERRLTEGDGEGGDDNQALLDKINYLPMKHEDYIRPKAAFFGAFPFIVNYSFLAFVPKGSTESTYSFYLVCHDEDLDDIKGEVYFNGSNGFSKVRFTNSSFSIDMDITVPTKRFIAKHIRLEIENIIKLVTIIKNLNRLQAHTIERQSQQIVLEEFVQPNYLFMFLRAEMDNISDGQTSYPDYGVGGSHIKAIAFNSEDQSRWNLNIGLKEEDYYLLLGILQIDFGLLGEDISYIKLNSLFYFKDDHIFLGERRFPDFSMYNQHFVAKRYIDMFASVVVNSTEELKSYKQLITPFATDAFFYQSSEYIPKLDLQNSMIIGTMGNASKIVEADTLSIKNFGSAVVIESCPVVSSDFIDIISVNDEGYHFHNTREYLRFDLDYCYTINKVVEDHGDEEEKPADRKLITKLKIDKPEKENTDNTKEEKPAEKEVKTEDIKKTMI